LNFGRESKLERIDIVRGILQVFRGACCFLRVPTRTLKTLRSGLEFAGWT
jgi:hypothetical protein